MTGRMQVLVDGEWVDVGGTRGNFSDVTVIPEPNVIVDEVQQMPTSFSMTATLAPESTASLMQFMRGRARAERANRRLWLRAPLPPRPMLCGRLPIARMPS